ncbi:unnamed protein product [Strongylus vulgaris]|uniref:Uncharacterized protein n=1 Tax=Strongylus vulgaris TaxID=40348 RepID=A0A3P7IN53_STRVU|nr:unnamed protein product [Strongylus vulgaris]
MSLCIFGNGLLDTHEPKLVLINLDWQNKDKQLPKQFVVKTLDDSMVELRKVGGGKLCEKVDEVEEIIEDVLDPVKIDQLAEELRKDLCIVSCKLLI